MTSIHSLRQSLEQLKGRKAQIEQDIDQTKHHIKENKKRRREHEQAREILRQVGLETQQQLQYHISDITSMALDAVFPDPYELVAEFVQRRNKTECDLYFQRNDHQFNPMYGSGVGPVDVASFALRVASWSMQHPRSRNVLILDEPFKHLSTDLQPKASEMLKQISEKLDLQIIMITHEEELMPEADRIFRTRIKNNITQVEEE